MQQQTATVLLTLIDTQSTYNAVLYPGQADHGL